MSRVKTAVNTKKSHKKVLAHASGYYGRKHSNFKSANEAVLHALKYAYRDRRARKRDFRRLWILRINAAARQKGLNYSQLMGLIHKNNLDIDRKILADLAVNEPAVFDQIVGFLTSS